MLADNERHLIYVSVVVVPDDEDERKCTPICTCESNQFLNQHLLKTLRRYCTLPEHNWASSKFMKGMAREYYHNYSIETSPLCIHAE